MTLEFPIAAYLRKSSDQQEDSHERQEAIIKAFLDANNLTIAKENWFTDTRARDEAFAHNANDFQALLAKVRKKQVRTVLVANMDRWGSENVDEFFSFRKIMHEGNVKLWSVEDGDLTSRNMVDIITLVVKAEQSREYLKTMARNIASGKERNAKAGNWNGGKCSPFGYDRMLVGATGKPIWLCHYETPDKRVIFHANQDAEIDFQHPEILSGKRNRPPKSKTDRNILVPSRTNYGPYHCVDGDRVKTVETIFQFLIGKPWSLNKMARTLTGMGMRYYGHALSVQRLLSLVQNEVYKGDITWNKTQRAKYAVCTNGTPKYITPVRHKQNRKHPNSTGTLKTIAKPKEEWTHVQGHHDGIVTPETWQEAQEWLSKKRQNYMPRSNQHYLRHLLWCGECNCRMYGKIQLKTGPNKTKVRYAGYCCNAKKHWIMHRDVENWLFDKLGQIGVEVNQATEMQALQDLYQSYHEHDANMDDFFRKGIKDYINEIKDFYQRHEIVDWNDYDADYLMGVAWSTLDNDFHGHAELKAKLQAMDQAKVEAAKKLLIQKKEEHRKACRTVMFAKDEMTQKVMYEEVEKLVHEMKEIEAETVPWMQRYQDMKTQLHEFQSRLKSLMQTIAEADIDGKAQRISEMVSRLTLHFQKKVKGQGRTVNPDKSSIDVTDKSPFL